MMKPTRLPSLSNEELFALHQTVMESLSNTSPLEDLVFYTSLEQEIHRRMISSAENLTQTLNCKGEKDE